MVQWPRQDKSTQLQVWFWACVASVEYAHQRQQVEVRRSFWYCRWKWHFPSRCRVKMWVDLTDIHSPSCLWAWWWAPCSPRTPCSRYRRRTAACWWPGRWTTRPASSRRHRSHWSSLPCPACTHRPISWFSITHKHTHTHTCWQICLSYKMPPGILWSLVYLFSFKQCQLVPGYVTWTSDEALFVFCHWPRFVQ